MATVEEIIEKARSLSPAERRKLIEALDRDLEQVEEQDRDKPAIETDREREAERARADLLRRAEAQGHNAVNFTGRFRRGPDSDS